MKPIRSIPVLLPNVADQRWSCHSCGHCCRSLVIHVSDEERRRIERQGWTERLNVEPVVRVGRSWALNQDADGACVFLDEHTRCRIHNEFGRQAKPLACRMFPFSVRATRSGWRASLRFDCPSVASSQGKPVERHQSWLTELVRELVHRPPAHEDVAALGRGVIATPDEIDVVVDRFMRAVRGGPAWSPNHLSGLARITATLVDATFKKVRGADFAWLLDVLFTALPKESEAAIDAPAPRQGGMFRQLVFAHVEHMTVADMRSGWISRVRRRWPQLRGARRFLKGVGLVPPLPGFAGEAAFASVDSLTLDHTDVKPTEDLLRRYAMVRLAGRSVFGAGYYGWPVFQGLAALWLGMAAAGWLARYASALRSASCVTADDAASALGLVDRAATRLPALGTMTERARVSYLLKDDGLARLVHGHSLVG